MLELIARLLLGAALLFSAALKLSDRGGSVEAMATYGFATAAARLTAWTFAVAAEVGLGIGVIVGSDAAALLAAALMLIFAATLGSALMAGKAGAPCGCLGPGSRVGAAAIARNLGLATGLLLLAL